MCDKEIRELEFALQVLERLMIWPGSRRRARTRLVADDQLGVERERACDAMRLTLTAAELVRVAVVEIGVQPDGAQQLLHAHILRRRDHPEVDQRLGDDVATVMRGSSDAYGS